MTTTYTVDQSTTMLSTPSELIMMLFPNAGAEERNMVNSMISKEKRLYVESHHKRSIFQIHSKSKYKDGKWRTYLYVDGKRRPIEADTKDEIYEKLYNYYTTQNEKGKSLKGVFDMLMHKKEFELGRSHLTVDEDTRYINFLPVEMMNKPVSEIRTEDIRTWLVNTYLPTRPKTSALKKMLQIIRQSFEHAIDLGYCNANPAARIKASDYAHLCDTTIKSDEDRTFSSEELRLLTEDAMKNLQNPRAVMMLLAKETGMRAGELSALRTSDIRNGFIHVHRQQLRNTQTGHQQFGDVSYTKDEKRHPHDGRDIPITQECEQVIEYAKSLPGISEYLIHDKHGNPVTKDSYEQNLRRRCDRLGIKTHHNHAFRVAFNSRLIDLGFSPADRALILGHSIETNERHYSKTDSRRLEELRKKIREA